MPDPVIYAFDPGDTTGWAILRHSDGLLIEAGMFKFIDACQFFSDREPSLINVKALVVEDWKLLGKYAKSQIGSDFKAIQVIGMIRYWGFRQGLQIHLQPPNIKTVAQKFTGLKPVGSHDNSHHIDAINHGCYYLRLIGHYKTKLEREGL